MSYSYREFQQTQLGRPESVTAFDLTQAAGTSNGKFYVPASWTNGIELHTLGFNYTAAAGAVTVPGKLKLQKNGSDVQVNGTTAQAAVVANAAAGASVEVSLNATTNGVLAAPSYPTALPGDVIDFQVGTQGTGGTETVFPYFTFRILPY